MITVNNVKKRFETVTAVDGVTFSTGTGAVFGLLGPNGAGKSTTIRMIMNIIVPDEGEIRIDGHKLSEKDKERIGYLPEERGLYKKSTVSDILHYFGSLKNRDRQSIQKGIDYWLERFDLAGWKNRKVSELSKGMAQKVQFITAVVHDPEILFFDEPFSGLDPVSSDALKESILDLGNKGKIILFSTHIMDHAEKLCSNIFIINKGKEIVSGSVDDIKRRYGRNSVAVEFEGDGSFIEGLPMVQDVIRYPRYVELNLAGSADPDTLLKALIGRIKIHRFEILAPSLHKIFVDIVKEKNNE